MSADSGERSPFLDLFHQDASNCRTAVAALQTLLRDFTDTRVKAQQIHAIENTGDDLTTSIFAHLHRGTPAPFDQTDMIALGSLTDDVLDGVDEVATMLVLYGVRQPTVYLLEASQLLSQAVEALAAAMECLDHLRDVQPFVLEVHALESEADGLYHNAIAELFLPGIYGAIDIVRWKSIYDMMERTMDKCEDLANVLENLLLKQR